MLITNVVDCEQAPGRDTVPPVRPEEPAIVRDLWQAYTTLAGRYGYAHAAAVIGASVADYREAFSGPGD